MCWECLPSLGTFRKHWFKTINNEAQTLFQLLLQLCAPSFFWLHCAACGVFVLRPYALSRFSHVQLFATPWTVAHQAPLSMGFSRQEHWSGLPFPLPGDLPGIKPASPTLQADSLPTEPPGRPALFHRQASTRGHGSKSVES